MADREDTPVKATATSARVIEALLELESATITELDDHLPHSKSTIHSHLETLEQLGFVVRDNWAYQVSLRFLEIGSVARNRYPLYQPGVSEVRQLATASGLVASLVVIERQRGICLYTAMGKKSDRSFGDPGETLPLHCTAPGKALLAVMAPEDVDSIIDGHGLREYTENTLTSRAALDEELQDIQSRGIAFNREEWREDVRGIAAAVEGKTGSPVGAISVRSPTDTMSGKRFQQDIPGLVISSANRLRKALRSER
ncbi:IclR family transcriptional regulator [Natrialba aegyptia]|uniref:ArcR family transcription regulator n=1 Tax=Natrialba aegyptia DSM 13077 TaxID=1227491 RepID=M0AKW9_9EURY|nr:IclR family transcriptional regulator [Natrialba aegyptia]ELY98567.1 ArcR family transcription regulator [Natrialba aegyptia DSM 13077]